MKIAILGATSQIAQDLVRSFAEHSDDELVLYARRPDVVLQWLAAVGLPRRYAVADFSAFNAGLHFDALLNFVGVGNPAQAAAMGASILDVTQTYDQLALAYVRKHPTCRYLFLSSGAAYGDVFAQPADDDVMARVPINHLQPQDWYGMAKLYAECCHRAQPSLPIIDIRVFNYFSRTQDMSARFLISDMLRAIRDRSILLTKSDYMVRDYLHPADFYRLVQALLSAPLTNDAVDCYTLAPVDKPQLLAALHEAFGLRYEVTQAAVSINATGSKAHYYSRNRRAAQFAYQPQLTSLEGVVMEMRAALDMAGGAA
jgi:nucleoside-diphosphate-sugar epimerase